MAHHHTQALDQTLIEQLAKAGDDLALADAQRRGERGVGARRQRQPVLYQRDQRPVGRV